MAIEIVDVPINSMVIFHSYVKLPEGNHYTSHHEASEANMTLVSKGRSAGSAMRDARRSSRDHHLLESHLGSSS